MPKVSKVRYRTKEIYEKGEDSFIMKRETFITIFRAEWPDLQRPIAPWVI